MTYIPVSGHKQSIAREKIVAREKIHNYVFELWKRDVSEHETHSREKILVGWSQRYSHFYSAENIFFFFIYRHIEDQTAIVREHPNSFLTAVSIKKVRKMRKEKVIEYYILILIDSISCNNKMESKGIEYFFFYRCTLLFIVTPFDIIIKINVLKVNCFYRVIQLDYALRL